MKKIVSTNQSYNYTFKVIMLGTCSKSKSNILLQLFPKEQQIKYKYSAFIGSDFKVKIINCQGKKVKLQIWDTAGLQRFKNIVSSYYKGAAGIVLVYDICNRKSFEDIKLWVSQICKFSNQDVVKILIGNKIDLESKRQIQYQQGQSFASFLKIKYFQTSSRNNINIQKAFLSLTQDIMLNINTQNKQGVVLQNNHTHKQKSSCSS